MSCANCGGDHSAAFRGYPKCQRAAQIQQVKTQGKLFYAEAVLMVPKMKTTINVVRSKTKTEGPVNVLTKLPGVQTETKDAEC